MEIINIIGKELFESILEIKDVNYHIDIHNDYNLKSIDYELNNYLCKIILSSDNRRIVEIIFEDVHIISLNLLINDKTIDNFYRGRYEDNGRLFEEFEGRSCFYIDFEEGSKINLLCKKAFVVFDNSK